MKKIAVIVAHPDDEVLGCGGSIAYFIRKGWSVSILILATGLTSRGIATKQELDLLKSQAVRASCILGTSDVEFCDLPDNSMDTLPLLQVVKLVENFLERKTPDIIFTHHKGDINVDHGITQRAVLTAARSLPETRPMEVLACEILSSTEYGLATERPMPQMYIRLSDEDVGKVSSALEVYKSELRDWPHPRSVEALLHQIRLRGAECGSSAAEAFEVLKIIR